MEDKPDTSEAEGAKSADNPEPPEGVGPDPLHGLQDEAIPRNEEGEGDEDSSDDR